VLAFGAATALIENGIRIPEDVAVSSFNNSILSRRCNIPLTSIEINPGKLGEEAVKLVIDAIVNGERGKRVIIQHQLHKRLSTEETDK
jgi:DNA-binding LacI/PurR family transcriptional regulator